MRRAREGASLTTVTKFEWHGETIWERLLGSRVIDRSDCSRSDENESLGF